MHRNSGTEIGGYRFIWKIENFSKCVLAKGECLNSPKFIVDELENTGWYLSLFPRGYSDSNHIVCYLNRDAVDDGPKLIKIRFAISPVSVNGIVQGETIEKSFKNGSSSDEENCFLERKRIYESKSIFLNRDVLSIECHLQKPRNESSSEAPIECTARSRICVERVHFRWEIEQFSPLYEFWNMVPYATKAKKPPPIVLKLCSKDKDNVCILKGKYKNKPIFVGCKLSYVDSKKNKLIEFARGERFLGAHVAEWILPSTLTETLAEHKAILKSEDNFVIDCEFEISVGVVMFEIEEIKILPLTSTQANDSLHSMANHLEKMFIEQRFCDVTFHVESSTLRAHKLIICARSPVFSAMFDTEMVENANNSVEVTDLDLDTMYRMLKFLYSEILDEKLPFESALKLYEAADKYQIALLSEKCFDFLKARMSVDNFCEILVVADLHQDEDLKSAVEDFMGKHLQMIMKWSAWKDLMENNFQLAVETLHKVLSRASN